jgi:hypothetical protein
MGGKIDLVRTFMVCIDGSTLFLKVVKCSPVLLCGDFWRSLLCFSWRSFEDDFLAILLGVTYEDLVPLWLVTSPPNLLESDSIWWFFELGEFLT